MITVTIAGSGAGELHSLLAGGVMQVTVVGIDGLVPLAQPTAAVPDVLIVHVGGDERVPPELADIRLHHPRAGIVIVTSSLAPAFLLEAIHAGVNEVIAEPLTGEKLEKAIIAVVGHRLHGTRGEVYGFLGTRSGVGKTTIAVNVAAALGAMIAPQRALLIDAHPFGGDASLFFGIEPAHSVEDALKNTERLDQALLHDLVTPVSSQVDLLAGADRIAGPGIDAASLREVIDVASHSYKYTVLDLPRSDEGVLEALQDLNHIVVVATQELASVRAGTRLVRTLQDRYGRDRVHVVLSRADDQADISSADIERALGSPIEYSFPSDYRAALHALHTGRPLALDRQRGLGQAIDRFAHRLSGARPPEAAHREGFFGRLTHAGA